MATGGTFGVELRRARQAAGLSLTDLAARLHYSKGHLSKLENGGKQPTLDLARRCDAVLATGGRLATLVPPAPPRRTPPPPERSRPSAGRPSPSALRWAATDAGTMHSFDAVLTHVRQLGRAVSPHLVLPQAQSLTTAVEELAAMAPSGSRAPLLILAARGAEYAGWMAQETGDGSAAREWTDRSVDLAQAAGDSELARYGVVRRAEFALYRSDFRTALDLLEAVQLASPSPRVVGLALRWQAQAYALAGDQVRWIRSLDRSAELLSDSGQDGGVGMTSTSNVHALVTGWCLLALGRAETAAEVLDAEVPRIPRASRRAAARFGVQQASAHAAVGDLDTTRALLPDLLTAVAQVDSATVRNDLRRLRNELLRWKHRSAAREAYNDLSEALLLPF